MLSSNNIILPTLYDFTPEKENRSKYGFCGLRNLGSTCYMNTLIQILYNNPTIRNYMIYQLNYDSYYLDEEKQGKEHSNNSNSSATGGAGGSGSLTDLPVRKEKEEEFKNDLGFQLQKLFLYLLKSEKKFYIPTDFTFAFKDETGNQPMNVLYQQDAQEFFLSLCHRFEENIKYHRSFQEKGKLGESEKMDVDRVASKSRSSLPEDIFQATFGCKLCDQRYVAPSSSSSSSSSSLPDGSTKNEVIGPSSIEESIKKYGIRSSEENTVCVSLSITGCNSLEESLKKFVEGEKINDYQWNDSDNTKVTIIKKQCLSSISNTIIFHLQRFTINFDNFVREKLNNAYTFPLKLSMKPYMKEYQETAIENGKGTEGEDERDDDYYEYELVGIIVHSGTSDSGHYIAYIKDQTLPSSFSSSSSGLSSAAESKKHGSSKSNAANDENEEKKDDGEDIGQWYEFNDGEISSFNLKMSIESECFGGKISSHEYITSTQQLVLNETTNSKNAYMVVYNRVFAKPLPVPSLQQSSTALNRSSTLPNNTGKVLSSSVGNDQQISSKLVKSISLKITKENHLTILFSKIITKEHFSFYLSLLKNIFEIPSPSSISSTSSSSSSSTSSSASNSSKQQQQRSFPISYSDKYYSDKRIYSIFYETISFLNHAILHSIYLDECKSFIAFLLDHINKIDDFFLYKNQESLASSTLLSTSMSGKHDNERNNKSLIDHHNLTGSPSSSFRITSPRNSIIDASSDKENIHQYDPTIDTQTKRKNDGNEEEDKKPRAVLGEIDLPDIVGEENRMDEEGDDKNKENIDQNAIVIVSLSSSLPNSPDSDIVLVSNDLGSDSGKNVSDGLMRSVTQPLTLPPKPPTVEEEKGIKSLPSSQMTQPLPQSPAVIASFPSPSSQYHYLSKIIVRSFNENIEMILTNLLYPSKEEFRKEISIFYYGMFIKCLQCESPNASIYMNTSSASSLSSNINLQYGTISTSMSIIPSAVSSSSSSLSSNGWKTLGTNAGDNRPQQSTASDFSSKASTSAKTMTSIAEGGGGDDDKEDEDDADLALAIQLSHGNINAPFPVATEEASSAPSQPMEEEIIEPTLPSNPPGSPTHDDMDEELKALYESDPDLALAIKLSRESTTAPSHHTMSTTSSSTTTTSAPIAAPIPQLTMEMIKTAFSSISHESIKFICFLTLDKYFQWIPENWRKSESLISLLYSLCTTNMLIRQILLQRDVISSIVDIIMGDQSPLNGKLYPSNSSSFASSSSSSSSSSNNPSSSSSYRKRCPSSFIVVNYVNIEKHLSSSAKHIPDWTLFLEIIVLLVKECDLKKSINEMNNNISSISHFNSSSSSTMATAGPSKPVLSEWDFLCLTNKSFYSVLIKQVRYSIALNELVYLFSYENSQFTNMIIEIILEEMSIVTTDNMHILFSLIERFLSVNDSLIKHRIYSLFGRTNQTSLFELMHTYFLSITNIGGSQNNSSSSGGGGGSQVNYGNKTFSLIVFIRSFLGLIMQIPQLYETITFSVDSIYSWSIWMYQYLLFQQNKYNSTAAAVSTTNPFIENNNPTSPTTEGMSGPFILVYGEDPTECEMPWKMRIEKTLGLLSTLLQGWEIIDLNRYVLPTNMANNAPVSTETALVAVKPQVMELHDGMSDEDIARYLASQLD
jgi:hypothetical protein